VVVYGVSTSHYQERLEKARPRQYVAVLHDQSARPTVVASLTGDGRTLKLDMLSRSDVPEDKVMQIWCLPEGKDQPVSMGMFKNSSVQFELSAEQLSELQQGGDIVVSIEPSGGSPVDRPSGPVKYRGRII
jgi:anti-sigma-K factor RskA